MKPSPRYPIYIPSKGRADKCLTARFLMRDEVPFRLVVEPQEYEDYIARFGEDHVLALPFRDRGSVIPARNWIKQHSISEGYERHWQLDDNIRQVRRRYKTKRIPCDSSIAFRVIEDFTDRYENVAISGMNYVMFAPTTQRVPPFFLNCHVYSCALFLNTIPYQWRGRYNEDTDMCLQALSGGWCTVAFNLFLAEKMQTMQMKGGNTAELYAGDGRLRMARSLERVWPGVVEVRRRFQRPQHAIKYAWNRFDTKLKLKPGIIIAEGTDEYGMKLVKVKEVKSQSLLDIVGDRIDE